VEHAVGIAMAEQSFLKRDFHPSEEEVSVWDQAMDVFT
jgi:hypothetical protein